MSVSEIEPVVVPEDDFIESLEYKSQGHVYLSGPIRFVEDNGHGWRDDIVEDYPEIDFLNPLDKYDPDAQEILNDPIHYDEESEKEQILPIEYVTEDKTDIRRSDALIVGLPYVKSRGTCMECMYAYMHNIPFFLWTIDEQEESGWLIEHATFVNDNRDRVMKEVKEWI